MLDVEQTLEDEGVTSFSKSFDELLASLSDKAASFLTLPATGASGLDPTCTHGCTPTPGPPRLTTMPSDADLLTAPLDELLSQARSVRDAAHGTRVTYSPKVFIPLTMLCRDRCGYCTFAKAPARLESPYLTPDEVLAIAQAGRAAGCHEALFTLGERPEERYPVAREWLAAHGYDSTVGLPGRHVPAGPRGDGPAPPRQCRRPLGARSWPRCGRCRRARG